MSKSLKRVKANALELGLTISPIEMMVSTKTAQEAADAISVHLNQIAKSVIFKSERTDRAVLFLTAGGNRVDVQKAEEAHGSKLLKADAAFIREETGFAIGGVSPIGHLNPIEAFFDPDLQTFPVIWAAAGTPHHMFEIAPQILFEAIHAKSANFTEER